MFFCIAVIEAEQYSLTVREDHSCPKGIVTLTCVSRNSNGDVRWYINGDEFIFPDNSHTLYIKSVHGVGNITLVTAEKQSSGTWFVNTTLQLNITFQLEMRVGCGSLSNVNNTMVRGCGSCKLLS